MTWHTWSYFSFAELLLCVAPGPAVLFVIGEALGRETQRSLSASSGILAANVLYFALSAAGLNAVLAASSRVFLAVKFAGAAYLIYLGARALIARDTAAIAPTSALLPSRDGVFRRGAALQLANPKAVLFFTALLPQFLTRSEPVGPQILVLGVTSVLIEFLVLFGYGIAASRASTMLTSRRAGAMLRRTGGLLLVGAGAGIAAARNA